MKGRHIRLTVEEINALMEIRKNNAKTLDTK